MTIHWINIKDTPPPIDQSILVWAEQTLYKEPGIYHIWYGSNTDDFYEGPDESIYILDESAWRLTESYEDRLTNQYWYERAPSFEWYSLINSPEEKV